MAISKATALDALSTPPSFRALHGLGERLATRPDEVWDWIDRLQAKRAAAPGATPRQRGVVPTPTDVAQRMASALLEPRSGSTPRRILDAGCGGGRLMVAVARVAAERRVRVDCRGIEIDPAAARWAQALEPLVRAGAGAALGEWTVRRADFLATPDGASDFDAVIANPPYVAWRTLDAASRARLRDRDGTASGDLAALFVDRLLDRLRPGGRLCVIVPNKLLAARYAAPLRRRLLEETCIESIWDLSQGRTFPGHGSYPVVIVARRRVPPARHRTEVRSGGGAARSNWRQRDLAGLPDHILPLSLAPELLPLLTRLLAGPRLGDVARFECGIAASGFGRAVGHGPERILRSGDILPFALRDAARFDPRAAGIPAARLERLRVPKVMVPGMFRRLCAAADDHGLLVGRVYFVSLEGAPAGRRALLLALLNSRLYALLYAGLFASVAQSGGWLRANTPYLRCLPWPEREPQADLEAAVRGLEVRPSAADRGALDARVEQLFGLSAAERGILARLGEGQPP